MLLNFYDTLFEWFRILITFLTWIWAVLVFLISYYRDLIDVEDNEFIRDIRGRGLRNVLFPILKILMVALTCSAASANPITFRSPGSIQYMNLNPFDGGYVFGYTTVDSARHERRSTDGTVEGRYSFINPDGKLIEVIYGADGNGFKASGNNIIPVDTPEVQMAKEAHRLAYMEQLARIATGNNAFTKQELKLKSPDPLNPDVYHDVNGNIDDSEVVVADTETNTPSPHKNQNWISEGYPYQEKNLISEGPIYYLAIPFFRYSHFVPISIHNFGRVAAVHDAQVPNSAQRNLFYSHVKQ